MISALFRVTRMAPRRTFVSSASDELVALDLDSSVAVLTMQSKPVNALSLEMFQALSKAIRDAEADQSIQALVLQSALPTIFSSGLDIMELHKPDPDRLVDFWKSFQGLYLDLYGSRLACVAAIEGHAPAAGCMLALSCDYRIMGNSVGKVGLNESQLGIVAPPWLGRQMIDTIGRREAEKALGLGTLYSPNEALRISLIDEVVEQDNVRERAMQVATQWAKIPPVSRVASKMLVRNEVRL
ncbi:hypothetical protein MPSEU_000377800 [Mayamaea pseudoterrestris]|nr:hypothetical protein MPSEU_000377800 [Mayamaea pseudoterrestris]